MSREGKRFGARTTRPLAVFRCSATLNYCTSFTYEDDSFRPDVYLTNEKSAGPRTGAGAGARARARARARNAERSEASHD